MQVAQKLDEIGSGLADAVGELGAVLADGQVTQEEIPRLARVMGLLGGLLVIVEGIAVALALAVQLIRLGRPNPHAMAKLRDYERWERIQRKRPQHGGPSAALSEGHTIPAEVCGQPQYSTGQRAAQ